MSHTSCCIYVDVAIAKFPARVGHVRTILQIPA